MNLPGLSVRTVRTLWYVSWLVLLSGCSSGRGGLFGMFSVPHKMIPQAKELSAAQAQPVALPRELDKHVSAAYTVEPGDVLLVQAVDLDSPVRLPGDQPILPDGTIQLGKYGRLQVAGKTLDEVEVAVKQVVTAQTRDAGPIAVRVITRQSKVFYVLGEVNAPGTFVLTGRETVLDAIQTAGGLTERASRDQIILSRPSHPGSCRVVLPICYNEIVQVGDTSTNYQLAAGDRIFVASKGVFDDLCPNKKVCAPCGGPHSPCPLPPVEKKCATVDPLLPTMPLKVSP